MSVSASGRVLGTRFIGMLGCLSFCAVSQAAHAQTYYSPSYNPSGPCAPVVQNNPIGAIISTFTAQQRAQACAEQQRAAAAQAALVYQQQQAQERQREQAQEQQREEEQASAQAAQDAATAAEQERQRREAAIREAVERHAEALAAVERRRAEVRDAVEQVAAYNQLVSAEKSQDNRCRQPDVARLLLESWSGMDTFKNNGMKAIDIEHLTTTEFDLDTGVMRCHGIFVINLGQRMIGSLEIKKNVAGDPISSWVPDASQDESSYQSPSPALIALAVNGPAALASASSNENVSRSSEGDQSASAESGLADRKSWEAWFAGLSGDTRDGATWWTSHRSLRVHASCEDGVAGATTAWQAGCLEAKQRLEPFDKRRKADPLYRVGWNSL